MTVPILVAIDSFSDDHMRTIRSAAEGWGRIERIPSDAQEDVYRGHLRRSEIAIGWCPAEWIVQSPVHYFQLPAVGYEQFLGHGLEKRADFHFCNGRGIMTIPVAEHGLALMLALSRRIQIHGRNQRDRRWERASGNYRELAGSTACVVGLGEIGNRMAEILRALGLTVIAVSASQAGKPHPHAEVVHPPEQLHHALARADHVILCGPARPDGSPILDSAAIAAMRPGSFVYNIGRGSLIDEEALIESLRTGHLEGAGLDVYAREPLPRESPLWEMDNVAFTPHVGGESHCEFDRTCALFVENLRAYREGRPLRNRVAELSSAEGISPSFDATGRDGMPLRKEGSSHRNQEREQA